MTIVLIKTKNEFAFQPTHFCESCNRVAEYMDTRPNGDYYLVEGYPDNDPETEDSVWFDLYLCSHCGHLTADETRPQWSDDDTETLYVYEVQKQVTP